MTLSNLAKRLSSVFYLPIHHQSWEISFPLSTHHCVRLADKYPGSTAGSVALGKLTEDDETDFLTFLTVVDIVGSKDEHVLKCQTVDEAAPMSLLRSPLMEIVQSDLWGNLESSGNGQRGRQVSSGKAGMHT